MNWDLVLFCFFRSFDLLAFRKILCLVVETERQFEESILGRYVCRSSSNREQAKVSFLEVAQNLAKKKKIIISAER